MAKPDISENELMKIYQMNSDIHEQDRERAKVINRSIKFNQKI